MRHTIISDSVDQGVERGPALSGWLVDMHADPHKRIHSNLFEVAWVVCNAFVFWLLVIVPYMAMSDVHELLARAGAQEPSWFGLTAAVAFSAVICLHLAVCVLVWNLLSHARNSVSRFSFAIASDLPASSVKKAFEAVVADRPHYAARLRFVRVEHHVSRYTATIATPGLLGFKAEEFRKAFDEAGLTVTAGASRPAGAYDAVMVGRGPAVQAAA